MWEPTNLAEKKFNEETNRLIGEAQLHQFGSFLEKYVQDIAIQKRKFTNNYNITSQLISIEERAHNSETIGHLVHSDNKILSRIIATLGGMCHEMSTLISEAEELFPNFVLYEDSVDKLSRHNSVSKILEPLQRVHLFVKRVQTVTILSLKQICCLLGKNMYSSGNRSAFPEVLHKLGDLLICLLKFDNLLDNQILKDHWFWYRKYIRNLSHSNKLGVDRNKIRSLDKMLQLFENDLLMGQILKGVVEKCFDDKTFYYQMKNCTINQEIHAFIVTLLGEMEKKMEYIYVLLILSVTRQSIGDDPLHNKTFPSSFMFGIATSAYQIEGAWDDEGKGLTIWDHAVHDIVPSPIADGSTGDVACDSYHKYKEDVALLKELGVNHYRFSLSWSRILPTGLTNKINEKGLTYYKNLIKELKDNKIEPIVTIFHWDTPQHLEETLGGWTNELIIDAFVNYARLCFETFGADVKYWLTFNEPKQTCHYGYGSAVLAPFVKSPGIGEYMCAHNIIKAHAEVWHLYDQHFRKSFNGKVGITIDSLWYEPDSDSRADIEAAERQMQFSFGWFANPLLIGNYPGEMRIYIDERSVRQGFPKSRLPMFTEEELKHVRGTVDMLGVNFYTSAMTKNKDDQTRLEMSWTADAETITYQKDEWESCATNMLKFTPWNLRKFLNWLKTTYGDDIPIMITENGVSQNDTSLEDDFRIRFIQNHLSYLRYALDDGVNVIGYTAWSLLDNFEWVNGYNEKFGLYQVNFDVPERTRTAKKSATYYKQVLSSRCLLDDSNDCISN